MTNDLARPIIGIENRTAQEVFDIMCSRFSTYLSALGEQKPVAWQGRDHQDDRWNFLRKCPGVGAWVETRPLYASPPPVRAITDEDVGRAAKAVSDEWGKMVAEMSPHMSPGDIARSFVSPGNHRLIRAALEAAGGRG